MGEFEVEQRLVIERDSRVFLYIRHRVDFAAIFYKVEE